jgi:hypothetical protein
MKMSPLCLGAAALVALSACEKPTTGQGSATPASLALTSPSLKDGAPIPAANACTDHEHLGASPPLAWSDPPAGAAGLAITMVDPDAKGFVHWAVLGLPAATRSLPEGASPGGAMPAGAVELPNDFGKPGYGGPCPPPGAPHTYVIRVYALKQGVRADKADAELMAALDASALAVGTLKVTFRR